MSAIQKRQIISATSDSSHSISVNHQKQQHQLFAYFHSSTVPTPGKNTGKQKTYKMIPLKFYPQWIYHRCRISSLGNNIQLVMGLNKLISVDMLWGRVLARKLWRALPNNIILWECRPQKLHSHMPQHPQPKAWDKTAWSANRAASDEGGVGQQAL